VPAQLASNLFEDRKVSGAFAEGKGSAAAGVSIKQISEISLREESDAQVVPGTGDECLFGIAVGRPAKEQRAE
jgi:hypothetical protein